MFQNCTPHFLQPPPPPGALMCVIYSLFDPSAFTYRITTAWCWRVPVEKWALLYILLIFITCSLSHPPLPSLIQQNNYMTAHFHKGPWTLAIFWRILMQSEYSIYIYTGWTVYLSTMKTNYKVYYLLKYFCEKILRYTI